MFENNNYKISSWSTWSKAYKTSFLIENKIYFNNRKLIGEDVYFLILLALYNPQIKTVYQKLYYYNISNQNSISNTNSNFNFIDCINQYLDDLIPLINNKNDFNDFFIDVLKCCFLEISNRIGYHYILKKHTKSLQNISNKILLIDSSYKKYFFLNHVYWFLLFRQFKKIFKFPYLVLKYLVWKFKQIFLK